jgi:hypothetical protein
MILFKRLNCGRIGAIGNRVNNDGIGAFRRHPLIDPQDNARIDRDYICRLRGNIVEATNVCGAIYNECRSLRSE